MNYPLFDDTVVIVIVNDKPLSLVHIPNDKYNVSEDLSLKIKEIFSDKNCNIIFGGTINYQDVIGLFGTEKFKQQSIQDAFYKYLIDYSNWNNIIKEIQNDLSNGKTEYFENERILKFVPKEYTIIGKISDLDKQIVNNILRKYQDVIGFEIILREDEKNKWNTEYLEIIIYPVFKQHRIISEIKEKQEITKKELSEEQIRNLIIDNLKKPIDNYFNGKILAVNKVRQKLNTDDNIFIISIEPVDLDWEIDYEYVSDFQRQYGYEPDLSDCYYEYSQEKFDNLKQLVENILGPLNFTLNDWEVSTEYKYVEFEVEYDKV